MQGVVRAVCAIIDAYHFGELSMAVADDTQPAGTAHVAGSDVQMADAETDNVTNHNDLMPKPVVESNPKSSGDGTSEVTLPAGRETCEDDDVIWKQGQEEAAVKLRQAQGIRSTLLKRVLPALNAQLVAKGDVQFLPGPPKPMRPFRLPLVGLLSVFGEAQVAADIKGAAGGERRSTVLA